MRRRAFVAEARDRGWIVVKRRGLALASKDGRMVAAGRAVRVPYAARLLDEPKLGTLTVW